MHPNEKFIRDLADYWNRGDIEEVKKLYRDDLVVTIPGRNLVSGVYRSKEDWWDNYISKVVELTNGTFEILKVYDAFANDRGAITMVRERFTRDGKTLEADRLFVYTIRDGQVAAIKQYEDDPYAIDEFFA